MTDLYWSVLRTASARFARHGFPVTDADLHVLCKHEFLREPIADQKSEKPTGFFVRSPAELSASERDAYARKCVDWLHATLSELDEENSRLSGQVQQAGVS